MPRYYCDYCDTYLTHDSPAVRKQHNSGYKHKANVRNYFSQFEEVRTEQLMDSKLRDYEARARQGVMMPGPPYLPQPGLPGPPPPGMMGRPPMMAPPHGMHPMMPGRPPMMGPPPPGMYPGPPGMMPPPHAMMRPPMGPGGPYGAPPPGALPAPAPAAAPAPVS